MPKKKSDTDKPEVWVCFDGKGNPKATHIHPSMAKVIASASSTAGAWAALVKDGWRCVRMVEAEDAAR